MYLLIKNILSLFALQASGYLIPLITTPYLARTLGVEHYGIFGIASSLIGYVGLVTDWGFGLTGTREVARNASHPAALRKIYWNTLFAKALLCGSALTVFIPAIWIVPQWHQMIPILLVFLVGPITGIFGTGWMLQGLEKIVGYATISLINRLLAVPLIFALVHSPEDLIVLAAIGSGLGITSAVISFWAANRAVALLPMHFDLNGAYQQIKSGTSTFLMTGGINLYTQSNVVLIGMIAGPVQVGLYLGADKIHWASLGLIHQVSAAVYPRINNLLVSSPKRAHKLMMLTLITQALFGLFLSVTMYLSAGIVTRVFLGNQFIDAIPIIQWFSAVPFLVGLSNAIGINMMFPFHMNTEVARITLASGVFNVVTLSLLTYIEGAVGAVISVVMTQALVTLSMAWIVYTRRKIIFKIQDASAV